MTPSLELLARRYVWWETPERTLEHPVHLICQLMQLGTWDDVQFARQRMGDSAFKEALRNAPPGLIDAKSWNYWNRFFGTVPVPPLPQRPLP